MLQAAGRLRRTVVLLGGAGLLLAAGCAVSLPPVAEMTDSAGIEALRVEFAREEYAKSILVARSFLSAHPGSKYVDEVVYILARSSYEEGNFLDAEDNYRRLLRDFPQSDFSEDSAYYLGLALLSQSRGPGLDQSETQAAHVQLRSFLNQYPNSAYAERARFHIASIREKLAHKQFNNGIVYFKAGRRSVHAALFYFETKVYQAYPETKWAPRAVIRICELHRKQKAWDQVAEWAGRYLADYPEGEQRGEARSLLEEALREVGRESLPAAENPAGEDPGQDPGEEPADAPGSETGGRRR